MNHTLRSDEDILTHLQTGTVSFISPTDLLQKLALNKRLIVKLGADPTAPDLHLGHAVVLKKMRDFQNLGHTVVFLIGDFTARIGDPTGRSKTRPPLPEEAIKANSKTYFEQVGRILDTQKIEIAYNSTWLSRLSCQEIVHLCAQSTLARLIEREDFAQRLIDHKPISFHELLYPFMQAYDSVALQADVELGGTDQTFNLLMGRFIQEQYGQPPQVVITVPILEGLSGTAKMSKSLGNTICLTESAGQAYGKLMSISDKLMWHYSALLLSPASASRVHTPEEVDQGHIHPLEVKKKIAFEIVEQFWSRTQAEDAQAVFESLVQHKVYIDAPTYQLPAHLRESVRLTDIVKEMGGCKSTSEARRLIEAGAIYLDGMKQEDPTLIFTPRKGMIIKIGKHKIYTVY